MCENITEIDDVKEAEEIKKFDITKKDTVFAIICFIISFLFSSLGVSGGFKGGFTLSAVASFIAFTVYLKKEKINYFNLMCGILSIGVSLGFSVTSNASVIFWSFVCYILLSLTWFTSLVTIEYEKKDLSIIKYIFYPILKSLKNIGVSFVSLFSGNENRNKIIGKVLLGVALAIPMLFVVVPLLMSSDAAFDGMVSLAFSNLISFILKLILGVLIFIFLFPYTLTLKKDNIQTEKTSAFKGIEPISVISFLSVLSICYLCYLFSQLAYFFGAFSGFLPESYEFTLSEYARRGFFEMTIIAAINFITIFLVLILSNKEKAKLTLAIKSICTFIGVFTLIIIATAFSKMYLYIKSFGMTILRTTTSTFMLFLAVVFIALLIRLFVSKIKVIKVGLITAGILLTILGTVNVNSFVASYNYNAYKNNSIKSIDVETIAELGDEGIPYLIKLTEDADDQVSHSAKLELSNLYKKYYKLKYNEEGYIIGKESIKIKASQFNLARNNAYKELDGFVKNNTYILNYEFNYYNNDYSFPF